MSYAEASDSPCSSSCSLTGSSTPSKCGNTWLNASWIQMEQRRLGRMEKYSQASWECPRVPIIQPQEFLSTPCSLLHLMGTVRELLALKARCRDWLTQRYLAHSLFDSLLLFPAWFPSLPYPLKPCSFTVAHFDSGGIGPGPGHKVSESPGGVHFLDVVGVTLTYRTV